MGLFPMRPDPLLGRRARPDTVLTDRVPLKTFFFTHVAGPGRSSRLKLSDTRVYGPQIRARLGTTTHFCRMIVLKSLA